MTMAKFLVSKQRRDRRPSFKGNTALSTGMEKQNSALEDRFGELSKRLDALGEKNSVTVTLHWAPVPGDGGLDLFSNHEELRFSELPAPLSSTIIQRFACTMTGVKISLFKL